MTRRLLLAWSVLWPMLFLGCAHLPPTNLPVCGEHDWNRVCRAPVTCVGRETDLPSYCRKTVEVSRDYEWEKWHVCPVLTPLAGHPTLGSCYVYRGVQDSRQVYEQVVEAVCAVARPRP